MKKSFVLVCACFIVSCAALPALRPLDRPPACPSPFLTEKTRLIHAIEAGAAGKTRAVLIGIALADPAARKLSAAVLTPEGVALLEASYGPSGAAVSRALPPFDSGELACRMMEDMALIFFAPAGEPVSRGARPLEKRSAAGAPNRKAGWTCFRDKMAASGSGATRKAAAWSGKSLFPAMRKILMPPLSFRRRSGSIIRSR